MQGANCLLFVVLMFVVSSGENNIVVANTITFVKTCLMDNIDLEQHTPQHISLQHISVDCNKLFLRLLSDV